MRDQKQEQAATDRAREETQKAYRTVHATLYAHLRSEDGLEGISRISLIACQENRQRANAYNSIREVKESAEGDNSYPLLRTLQKCKPHSRHMTTSGHTPVK